MRIFFVNKIHYNHPLSLRNYIAPFQNEITYNILVFRLLYRQINPINLVNRIHHFELERGLFWKTVGNIKEKVYRNI